MDRFKKHVIRKYRKRRIQLEEQIIPVRGEKLVKLQLVESAKEEGYAPNWQRGKASDTKNSFRPLSSQSGIKKQQMKRVPIQYDEIFRSRKKKEVRRLLAEGEAGVGKSTFCTAIAEGWADKKILQQFNLLLYLPLREKEVASAESLHDLLRFLYARVDESLADEIEDEEGEDVLIILDGWDELTREKRENGYIYDLVVGKELSDASVLVTSRPSASAPLHKQRYIDRCIEIVGFNKEDIKEYIESEFADDDDPGKAARLLDQLDRNPLVASLCTIPLNCAIVVHLWRTSETETLPASLSGLYRDIILNLVLRDIYRSFPEFKETTPSLSNLDSIPSELQSSWWSLCEFAFHAIDYNQLIFSQEELPNVVKKDNFTFGLLQKTDSPQSGVAGRVPTFHFLHYTFQEYLAALHLAKQSEDVQLYECSISCELNRSDFDVVWRFFFGITSAQGKPLSTQLKPLSEKVLVSFFERGNQWNKYSMLCHCALEANSSYVTSKVFALIGGIYRAHTSFDLVAVMYMLSNAPQGSSASLDFENCNLGAREMDEP